MIKNDSVLFILPFAMASLLFGIIAGWQRINIDIPIANLAGDHGAVMTGSFIGTLICLERSITERNKWWRLLPLINACSLLLFLFHLPSIAYVFLLCGSIGLLILLTTYLKTTPTLSNVFLLAGAFAWLTGNLVLLNQHSYPSAVKWWMLFLLWTIYGERLELSSMLPMTLLKKWTLYIIIVINVAGVLLPFHWYGNEIFATSLLALSAWLFSFDMSRHAIKHAGQHRYIGYWLLTGYFWLIVAASWLLFWPNAAYSYDAHCVGTFLERRGVELSEIHQTLFVNYNDPNHFVNVSSAEFVVSSQLKSPMGGNAAAFKSKEEASKKAAEIDGSKVTNWATLYNILVK